MKILSIIIPHYNDGENLIRLVNSIPERKDLEIIIIDDNSTKIEIDKVKSIVLGDNIKLFINKKKNSAGRCRNIGIRHSRAKFILFADSDDYFHKDNLNDIIENLYQLDYDIQYYQILTEKDMNLSNNNRGYKINKKLNAFIKNKSKKNEITIRTRMHSPCAKVFLRSFIEKNNIFFDQTMYSNDVMFSLKTGILAKKILVSKVKIYTISNRPGSLTNTKTKESIDVRDKVYKDYIQYINNNNNNNLNVRLLGFRYLMRSFKTHKSLRRIFSDLKFLKKNKIKIF